jgi:proline dehydrogenase
MKYMKDKGLPNNCPAIYMAQLYGMSDNLSFNAAKAGYNVAKYLPYGKIRNVLPYLVRRAEENSAIAGQTARELIMLKQELKRRKSLK